MRLTKLTVNSVRGIPPHWVDLPIGKRGLVIYGPNGVGKSSIIDSLEFGLTKQSTLFPTNRVGVNWEKASPHILGGKSEILVEIWDGSNATSVNPTVEKGSIPTPVQSWLSTAEASSFILRRHMLLRFIDNEPKNRYEILEPFLNLGPYLEIESALKSWLDQLETARATEKTRQNALEQKLITIFALPPEAPITEDLLLQHLNNKLKTLSLASCSNPSELKSVLDVINAELGDKSTTDRLAKLGGLKNQVQKLGLPRNIKPLLEQLYTAVDVFEKEKSKKTEEILTDLLAMGKQIIEKLALQVCPLCENQINSAQVLQRLEERIEADQRITEARHLVESRSKALLDQTRTLNTAFAELISDWRSTVKTSIPIDYDETSKFLTELVTLLDGEKATSTVLTSYVTRLDGPVSSHDDLIKKLDALLVEEGGGQKRLRLNEAATMTQSLIDHLPLVQGIQNSLASIARQQDVIQKLHSHAIEARKLTVQEVLDAISNLANTMYEKIHPGEHIGKSTLSVREAVAGSVNLESQFYGNDESPLLHHSESHLDTLGLCYFLAIRKYESAKNSAFKVLVLDDVLHSVDADHRSRFANLVRNEFSDHQIIITTHDPIFYQLLKIVMSGSDFNFLAITGWNVERGPLLSDPSTDLDRILSDEKEKKSPEELSAAGGRLFELMLKRLTERLVISVPAKFEATARHWRSMAPIIFKAKITSRLQV